MFDKRFFSFFFLSFLRIRVSRYSYIHERMRVHFVTRLQNVKLLGDTHRLLLESIVQVIINSTNAFLRSIEQPPSTLSNSITVIYEQKCTTDDAVYHCHSLELEKIREREEEERGEKRRNNNNPTSRHFHCAIHRRPR